MSSDDWLTTGEIGQLFCVEIEAAGGTVIDTFDDDRRLFARSVLPGVREVRPGDELQGGVALRTTDQRVYVHPYVFRLVCKNGAIRAHAIQTEQIDRRSWVTGEAVAQRIRAAVQACCAPEAFSVAVEEIRSARETEADHAINMMSLFSQ